MTDNFETNWTVNGTLSNGTSIFASGKIIVNSTYIDNVVVPPKVKFPVNIPSIDGVITLILIRAEDSNLYQYLAYSLDDSTDQIKFENGALVLIGGVNKLIPFPKKVNLWYNSPDPAHIATGSATKPATITIIIGSKPAS
jgi:hypothetical protein